MRTYKVELTIRAETETDVEELLEYTGNETYIEIKNIKLIKEKE